ncbi:MAG: glutamate--cysteine ligase, partial [Acinetobacter sp.]
MAQQHAMSYEQHQLSPDTLSYFDDLAVQSLQQQQQLEQDSSLSFEQYLADYR